MEVQREKIEVQNSANFLGEFEPLLIDPIPGWKRLFDIAGASIGLLLFAPAFIVISIFIKLVSRGPVFFKQERVGRLGKIFTIYKFRTMLVHADTSRHKEQAKAEIDGNLRMCKANYDDQIIPFGKVLRKTGLDELPQLINVLKGDMSLVGPRPELPYAVREYERWHRARFDTNPGITGLWQINGKNSTTFTEMIRYDINYKKNLSFRQEMKIILLTIPAIFGQFKDNN